MEKHIFCQLNLNHYGKKKKKIIEKKKQINMLYFIYRYIIYYLLHYYQLLLTLFYYRKKNFCFAQVINSRISLELDYFIGKKVLGYQYIDKLPINATYNNSKITLVGKKIVLGPSIQNKYQIILSWGTKIKNCSYMFSDLVNIQKIDLSNFDFSHIENM